MKIPNKRFSKKPKARKNETISYSFTDDLLEAWVSYKRVNEVDALRIRPHPWEFHLYYDI